MCVHKKYKLCIHISYNYNRPPDTYKRHTYNNKKYTCRRKRQKNMYVIYITITHYTHATTLLYMIVFISSSCVKTLAFSLFSLTFFFFLLLQ